MFVLNNINLEELKNGTLYDIAWDLGCDIHMPEMEKNKYFYDSIKNPDLINSKEWLEDQKRCDEINKEKLDQFDDDMFNWLLNNDYIKEV